MCLTLSEVIKWTHKLHHNAWGASFLCRVYACVGGIHLGQGYKRGLCPVFNVKSENCLLEEYLQADIWGNNCGYIKSVCSRYQWLAELCLYRTVHTLYH